jgi:hypothetical protein
VAGQVEFQYSLKQHNCTTYISGVYLNFSSRVEELIVNAPFVSLLNKNTNNAESEVRFKQLIPDL